MHVNRLCYFRTACLIECVFEGDQGWVNRRLQCVVFKCVVFLLEWVVFALKGFIFHSTKGLGKLKPFEGWYEKKGLIDLHMACVLKKKIHSCVFVVKWVWVLLYVCIKPDRVVFEWNWRPLRPWCSRRKIRLQKVAYSVDILKLPFLGLSSNTWKKALEGKPFICAERYGQQCILIIDYSF